MKTENPITEKPAVELTGCYVPARIIMFRAWDEYNKEMINPYCQLIENRFHGEDLINTHYVTPVCVMQFTGLFDKSGKGIYEGDIVRWDDCSDGKSWRVAVVNINPDIRFKIIKINSDMIQSAQEGYIFKYGNFAYKDTENHLEIIGNVFDNADLLAT